MSTSHIHKFQYYRACYDTHTGVERVLLTTAGKYSFGDMVTFADICLVPQVFNAIRFGVSLDKFPTIVRVNANLSELEEFKKAHPLAQPDKE